MFYALEAFCEEIAKEEKNLMMEFVWAKLLSYYSESSFQRSLLRKYSHTGEEIWKGMSDMFLLRIKLRIQKRKNTLFWSPTRLTEPYWRYECDLVLDPETFLVRVNLPSSQIMSLMHLLYAISGQQIFEGTNLSEVSFRTYMVNHLLSSGARFRYICNENDDYLSDVIRQHMQILETTLNDMEKRIFGYMVQVSIQPTFPLRELFRPISTQITLSKEEMSYFRKKYKEWKPLLEKGG